MYIRHHDQCFVLILRSTVRELWYGSAAVFMMAAIATAPNDNDKRSIQWHAVPSTNVWHFGVT